jgi:hypothetical protein
VRFPASGGDKPVILIYAPCHSRNSDSKYGRRTDKMKRFLSLALTLAMLATLITVSVPASVAGSPNFTLSPQVTHPTIASFHLPTVPNAMLPCQGASKGSVPQGVWYAPMWTSHFTWTKDDRAKGCSTQTCDANDPNAVCVDEFELGPGRLCNDVNWLTVGNGVPATVFSRAHSLVINFKAPVEEESIGFFAGGIAGGWGDRPARLVWSGSDPTKGIDISWNMGTLVEVWDRSSVTINLANDLDGYADFSQITNEGYISLGIVDDWWGYDIGRMVSSAHLTYAYGTFYDPHVDMFDVYAEGDLGFGTVNVNGTPVTSLGRRFAVGASVTVEAIPSPGFYFAGWASDALGISGELSNPYTFSMPGNPLGGSVHLWATFLVAEYEVTIEAGPGGSVSHSGGWFMEGDLISVTATANSGFRFAGWTSVALGMEGNMNETLTFYMPVPPPDDHGWQYIHLWAEFEPDVDGAPNWGRVSVNDTNAPQNSDVMTMLAWFTDKSTPIIEANARVNDGVSLSNADVMIMIAWFTDKTVILDPFLAGRAVRP